MRKQRIMRWEPRLAGARTALLSALSALLLPLAGTSRADDLPVASLATPIPVAPAGVEISDAARDEPPSLHAELQDVTYVRALVPPVQLGPNWRTLYQLHHAQSGGDLLILAKGSNRLAVYARRTDQLAGKAARYALTESTALPELPPKPRFSRCSLPDRLERDVITLSGHIDGKPARVWALSADTAGRLRTISPPQLERLRCATQGVNVRPTPG